MKMLLQKHVLLCLGLIGMLLLFYNCDQKEEKHLIAKLAIVEDTVKLDSHAVARTLGNSLISLGMEKILINCNKRLDTVAAIINATDLEELKAIAKKIDTNYTGHYVLGIRFIYTLNNAFTKVKLAYQPTIMKRVTSGSSKSGVEYESDTTAACYIYNPTTTPKFTEISKTLLKEGIRRYKDSIKFVIGESPRVCRSFISANDSTGDVKRLIFSFQEIDTLIANHGATQLYILNAAESYPANHTSFLKHILLLGSEKFNQKDASFLDPIFYRKFGNLSHLCPPSCTRHLFDLK